MDGFDLRRFLIHMKKQKVTINNIAGQGLNLDLDPIDLPTSAVTNGKNFRIKNGRIETVPAAEIIASDTNITPGYVTSIKTATAILTAVAGLTKVLCFDGSSWSDITSAAGYAGLSSGDEFLWSSCLLGNIPIFNNFSHVPEYWSPVDSGQILQPLQFDPINTWAAKNYAAKTIRSHGQYLFALNLQEGANYLPDSYRWSHPADINGLPFTWDETDLSAIAGKSSIGGDSGAIVDGLSLRDAFIIYSERAINALSLSGDEFVWRKIPISTGYGLAAKDAIVEISGVHYFISQDDICMNDGSAITSLTKDRIKTSIASRTNFQYIERSFAFHYLNENEIWFCIPSDSNTTPSLAYIFNYLDKTWAVRDLPVNTAFISYGIKLDDVMTWDSNPNVFDSESLPWSWRAYAAQLPLGVINSATDLLSIDDPKATSFLDILIERTSFKLKDDYQGYETINRIYPKFAGKSVLNFQIGSQNSPMAPIRWTTPTVFDIASQRTIQRMTTGCLHSYKIFGTPTGKFTFNGLTIEYTENGER
jgi:hypothetical protein